MQARASTGSQKGLTLIEVLIGIVIGSILTTMILMGWFSLQKSYSSSTQSTKQREVARDAMSRMVRELRDAQANGSNYPLQLAKWNEVRFYTAFNDPGSGNTGVLRLTRYWYDAANHQLIRQRDTNKNGRFSKVLGGNEYLMSELDPGDRLSVMLTNVSNTAPDACGDDGLLFRFLYYDSNGDLQTTKIGHTGLATVGELAAAQAIRIRLLVDLTPGHTPVAYDLQSTAQLRNMRTL